MKNQKVRKNIIRYFWKIEVENEMMKLTPKTKPDSFSFQVTTIPEEIRDGIIDKWLSYRKCESLTEQQIWRILVIKREFREF
jgi:hypothetical protein